MALEEGAKAPPVHSADFDLAKQKGKRVVLFFFPKVNTSGCTKEACGFRDSAPKFARKDAVIVGISPDKPEAGKKWIEKLGLPYTLVGDTDHSICQAYGVWKKKNMYGVEYMGVERTTFIVGADGRIEKIYRKVRPEGHAEQVLAELGA